MTTLDAEEIKKRLQWIIDSGYIHKSQAVDCVDLCKECKSGRVYGGHICEVCNGKGIILKETNL